MARVALNKSSLQKEVAQLKMYNNILPSLELKRQQLNAEYKKARQYLAEREGRVKEKIEDTAQRIPMLASPRVEMTDLVQIDALDIGEENVVGVKLPVLRELRTSRRQFSKLSKPHWVDIVQENLHEVLELRARVDIAVKRVEILRLAVRRITQRVNLFKEVLIPEAKKNIKLIKIALAENDRQAVVRSKITKAKQKTESMEVLEVGDAQ